MPKDKGTGSAHANTDKKGSTMNIDSIAPKQEAEKIAAQTLQNFVEDIDAVIATSDEDEDWRESLEEVCLHYRDWVKGWQKAYKKLNKTTKKKGSRK